MRSGGTGPQRMVHGLHGSARLTDRPGNTARFAGRSVLVHTAQQLPAVMAMVDLDGVARRITLAPPEAAAETLLSAIGIAGADTVITDQPEWWAVRQPPGLQVIDCDTLPTHHDPYTGEPVDTEWVLFTSGTTGAPKLVSHTLGSLLGRDFDASSPAAPPVWCTFYDVRRYGGLQILLRALTGPGAMVLSDPAEDTRAFLARAGAAGVTHISGTPSHWRRALISGQASLIDPAYVRLSGEIADQPILDRLRAAYPRARIAHAFASTEAGVAFDVDDERAGFPAAWIDQPQPGEHRAALKVADGTLRIRSGRVAGGYVGQNHPLADAEGFVDTGDIVARQDDRYHFLGRAGGVINVGGHKVHPEEVEAALQAHPGVLAARAMPRPSPIMGAVVAAQIVLRELPATPGANAAMRQAVLTTCRATLAAHKVPAVLDIVARLDMLPSGKLARPRA